MTIKTTTTIPAWVRQPACPPMREIISHNDDGSELITLSFPMLEDCGIVRHFFTTRDGGVSKGRFRSMNLSSTLGDDRDRVLENFRRLLAFIGADAAHLVSTVQTHTTNVRRVTHENAGRGLLMPYDYTDVDGLITDEPGLVLAAFGSDCPVLYFVDPVRRAIGLSHAGWRGTIGGMARITAEAMQEAFGTRPEELLVAISPCICRDCYEVSEDVASRFREAFPGREAEVLTPKGGGKSLLDLKAANRLILEDAGVRRERIVLGDLCTCCNPDRLFSHRATKGKRGNNGAFLMLKP